MTSSNVFLRDRSRCGIEAQVDRILRDLGLPEPPLRLDEVRELLKLDLQYYSASTNSFGDEVMHKVMMAGKQVLKRPTLLVDAIKKCNLKALFLFDKKRILISKDLPERKHRWGESHEIGHSILPWHEHLCHGDAERTLSPACHDIIEAEANYTAGQLLFLRSRFREELLSSDVDVKNMQRLAKRYGNSITSTVWRGVETLDVPAFMLVSTRPTRFAVVNDDTVRYFVRSKRFAAEFSTVGAGSIFSVLPDFCVGRRGPLGTTDVAIPDDSGFEHVFKVECFFNGHEALTLGVWQRARAVAVAV